MVWVPTYTLNIVHLLMTDGHHPPSPSKENWILKLSIAIKYQLLAYTVFRFYLPRKISFSNFN